MSLTPHCRNLKKITTPSVQIFNWLNRVKSAILDLKKYKEIAKSVGGIKFNKVKKQCPKIFYFIFLHRTTWKF